MAKKQRNEFLLLYFWESSDRAQELGAVADGSGPITQIGGELWCLAEVVLLVNWRLVVNTWRMEEKPSYYN